MAERVTPPVDSLAAGTPIAGVGLVSAVMRPFGLDPEQSLEVIDLGKRVVGIGIPSFGHLVIGPARSNEPIVRLVEHWIAVLAQPSGNRVRRDVRVQDGRLEVELLPNTSGEDRLLVVIRGLLETTDA